MAWLDSLKRITAGLFGAAGLENRLQDFDPSTDQSIRAIAPDEFLRETWYLTDKNSIEVKKTKIKEFKNEEDMKRAVFLYTHYNVFGKTIKSMMGKDWHQTTIFNYGFNQARGKWFVETDYVGDGVDYAELIRKEEDAGKIVSMLEDIIENAVIMEVAAPLFLKPDKRWMKKHGADKAHRGISEYSKSLDADFVQTDVAVLRQALNSFVNNDLMDETFFTDSYPGNWIIKDGEPARIDLDGKQRWFFGNFNRPHIINYSSRLSEEQREYLNWFWRRQKIKTISYFNQYVEEALENPKDTVCDCIDIYMNLDEERSKELKQRIMDSRDKKDITDYVKMIEHFDPSLKDRVYMIRNHLSNLKERDNSIDDKDEVKFYVAQLVRSLASCGGKGDRRRKETDIDKYLYLCKEQRFQLELAIDSARCLEDYAQKHMSWSNRRTISKMRATLEKDYEAMYKVPYEKKEAAPAEAVANPIRIMPVSNSNAA
ncbi:hypothetical protein GF371_01295 [Candidatus Woesearchaeota archaeon]|nr:hypothetical protein [Candidatus Woesearchaeota archaeon]